MSLPLSLPNALRSGTLATALMIAAASVAPSAQAQTDCIQCPSGLIAWWPGDGSGTNLAGTGDGSLENGASFAPGLVGDAFAFDGGNDYVQVGPERLLVLANHFTIQAWIFPTGPGTPGVGGIIVNKEGECEFARYPDGSIRWAVANASPGWTSINTGFVAPVDAWTHLAFTYSGGMLRTFANGSNVHSHAGSGGLGDAMSTENDFRIGGRQGSSQYFEGLIDEVAIFNRALSANEIAAIYAAGTNGMCKDALPPTLLSWPTNQFVAQGADVTFRVAISGTPPISSQWVFEGALLPGATNDSLTLSNVAFAQTGSYVLTATNLFGSATSHPAMLVVDYPFPGASWDVSGDYSITHNPNGVWSYCRKWSVEGLAADVMSVRWGSSGWYLGNVGHGGPAFQAGPILWAKNNSNGYPATRWRCPKDGFYRVEGTFRGADSRGVDNFVYVVVAGQIVFADRIRTPGEQVAFELDPGFFEAGASIDFVVVWAGGVYSEYGWTGLNAVVSRIGPEELRNPTDFETGWGDWYTEGPILWQVRPPGNGPLAAHTGVTAACGNLGGNYWANSTGRLISPSFSVPAVNPGDLVTLRFWQWYQYGTGDSGVVQISVGSGSTWFPWETLAVAATTGTSAGWQQQIVDLTPYQGQHVRLGFLHTANNDSSVGAGWFIDDVEISSFVPSPIDLNQPYTGTFGAPGERQYFVVQVPPGGHLNIHLTGPAGSMTEIYARRGALPSAGAYDYRFLSPGQADQHIFVPDAQSGPWYIYVYADSLPNPGEYTLEVEFFAGIVLQQVTPDRSENSGSATLEIQGAGFDSTAQVFLVSGAGSIPAAEVSFVSSSRLIADFELEGVEAGTYELTVVQDGDAVALTFEVVLGIGPRLETRLVVPSRLGYHTLATLYVEFQNTGDAVMPAPLLELDATQNGQPGAWLTLTEQNLVSGFWTSAQPEGFSHSVQFIASGRTPGLLQPGESGRVPVYYAGWKQPWDFRYPPFNFRAGILMATDGRSADWFSLKDRMQPDYVRPDAWNAIWLNFIAQTGNAWGGYLSVLNENATYLSRLGVTVTDITRLLAFELRQADALSPIRYLAQSTDAAMTAPGLSLTFWRGFAQPISRRYELGPLGRGWAHEWQWSLRRESDGTVRITGMTGTPQIFQPDSRHPGAYFAAQGDHDVLTALSGGAFQLRKPDGMIHVFRSDRKLDYVEDTNGNRITCGYSGDFLVSLAHSAGPHLAIAYHGSGRIQSVTDSQGRQTLFTYDGPGEHLIQAQAYDGRITGYSYLTGQGATREHALSQVAYPGGSHRKFTYDAQGRISSTFADGNAGLVTFGYDSTGTVTASNSLGDASKFFFDDWGQILKAVNPLGHSVLITLDDKSNVKRVTDPAGRVYDYQYDAMGNLTRFTDPLGYSTRFTYTADLNRLSSLLDAKGNLTRYNYDSRGNPGSIVYPNASAESWAADATGQPTSWTNRRGRPIEITWNAHGLPTRKTYMDGTSVDYAYDARNNLTNTTDSTGTTIYSYDADEYLTRIDYPGDRWLKFTYDAAGRRASSLNQLGHRLDYFYDAPGRLSHIVNEVSVEIVRYHYDPAGRLARKDLGNGVYATYEYDAAGQVLHLINHKPEGSVLSRFDYAYDNRGRRTAMGTIDGAWTYQYDEIGQLTRAIFASTNAAIPSQNLNYAYDALGNRTQTVENGTNTAYTANNMNQYTQVGNTAFVFDADGNLIQETSPSGATTYSYDDENRLTTVMKDAGSWAYAYDAFGQRARSSENGTTMWFVMDPVGLGDVVGEYDSLGNLIARYDHGFGLLSRTDALGSKAWYTFDAIGNTGARIGASGDVINSYVYAPFGAVLQQTGDMPNPFQFVGEWGVMHERNGLEFMRARYYAPETGRFIQSDPIGIFGGPNIYVYAFNAPAALIDPSGLKCEMRWSGKPWASHRYVVDDEGWEYHFAPESPLGAIMPFPAKHWRYRNGEVNDLPWGTPVYWLPMWNCWHQSYVDYKMYCAPSEDPVLPPQPPTNPGGDGSSTNVISGDPNELLGPSGYGPQNFVRADSLLPYTIHFENETNATAPAQRVVLSNHLTNLLDWTTFELTEIAFGDQFIAVPPQSKRFEHTVKMSQDGYDFEVQIEAGIRLDTGEAYARFQSLNPTNGLPPPVEIGMLPPEDGTGRGMGHVSYVIRAQTNLVTGTEIRNVAYIVFDGNPPIGTDWVDPHDESQGIDPEKQALVTIDADGPTSSVLALPAESPSPLTVAWSGDDLGAGVASYDIYVSTDAGPWTLWLSATPDTEALFEGVLGSTYAFYSMARDGVGHVEPARETADAATLVTTSNHPPELDPIPDQTVDEGVELELQLVADDPDLPLDKLTFDLVEGPDGVTVSPDGLVRWAPAEAQGPSTNTVTVRVTDDGVPNLSATANFLVVVREINLPPELVPIPDQHAHPLSPLTVQVEATDPDLPPNVLTYDLVEAPEGMTQHAETGVIHWTPAPAHSPGTFDVIVRVTDDNPWAINERHLIATGSFTVTVRDLRLGATLTEQGLTLTVDLLPGRQYRVESCDDLGTGLWTPVPDYESIDGTGAAESIHLPVGEEAGRFYRVLLAAP